MIKVEPCKGCGAQLMVDRFMGVTVRCDPTPLDAQTAIQAVLASQTLYRVHALGGRPSSFGSASHDVLRALKTEPSSRPVVVPEHRCTPNGYKAPQTPSQAVGGTGAPVNPPKAPVGPSAPSSGSSRPTSSALETAHTAATPDSRPQPRCYTCGEPCEDGTFAAIELGDILVWATHVEECGK